MTEVELAARALLDTTLRVVVERALAVDDPALDDALARLDGRSLRVSLIHATRPADASCDAAGDPAAVWLRLRFDGVADDARTHPVEAGSTRGHRLTLTLEPPDDDALAPVDVELVATAATLMAASGGEIPPGLSIRGDAGALRDWQRLFAALRRAHGFGAWRRRLSAALDTLLAPLGGAGYATRADQRLARLAQRLRHDAQATLEDAVVFAQREKHWLPEPEALEDLAEQTADLRDRLARLERRTQALEAQIARQRSPST